MEPKNKNFLEKIGFGDEDLRTSKHDEIMLWLLDRKNLMRVLEEAFPVDYSKCQVSKSCFFESGPEECSFRVADYSCDFTCLQISRFGGEEIDREEVVSKDFEALRTKASKENWKQIIYNNRYNIIESVKLEVPVKSGNYLIGFADCKVVLSDVYVFKGEKFSLFAKPTNAPFNIPSYILWIEVKTKIDSIGALLRQINTYREYTKGLWMVISPEDWIGEILRSQGIYHYTYNPKR